MSNIAIGYEFQCTICHRYDLSWEKILVFMSFQFVYISNSISMFIFSTIPNIEVIMSAFGRRYDISKTGLIQLNLIIPLRTLDTVRRVLPYI